MDSSPVIMAASISDSQLSLPTLEQPDDSVLSFPIEFPYEFDSFCPVDSTETESSDEDELASGLTRSLTHHLALDPKGNKSGSPKSTLSGIGSWSTSPPTTRNDSSEPIYGGAGDVSRSNQNSLFYSDQGFVYGVSRLKNLDQVNQSYSVWGRQQLEAGSNHLQQIQIQNQIHSRGISCTGYGNSRYVRPLGLPHSAWPPLQVRHNKHRSAFVAGSGAKRGCAGTGVFLPRRFDGSTNYNNKSDCSTVTAPAKAEDYKTNGPFASKHDESLATRIGEPKGDLERENGVKYELCLPQEWIY